VTRVPEVPGWPVPSLVTWELRNYRRDLEAAIAAFPEASPQRMMCAGRLREVILREVITEQEARSKATGLPVTELGSMNNTRRNGSC
jgi:hypothetical protein